MTIHFQSLARPIAFAIGLGGATVALAQDPSFSIPAEPGQVPGQFIIKTAPGVEASSLRVGVAGAEVVEVFSQIGAVLVEVDEGGGAALRSAMGAADGVAYIEPVYKVYALATPNDPSAGQQWGWDKINAPAAWDVRTDGSSVLVGVIDTGVDYRHPDLAANMWTNPGEIAGNGVDDDGNGIVDDVFGANFHGSRPTGDPMDGNRHGTHVAGTIGAVSDNALGVAGVNWTAQIMAIKFLGDDGSGTSAGAIRAIEYGVKMGAKVLNNSWGGGGRSQAVQDAIEFAHRNGVLFVAAAGNGGRDGIGDNNDAQPHFPSNYDVDNVLSVAATDERDGLARFSNFGVKTVDMGAPGVNILSSIPGGGQASFNGTSMATPHVAGAAALVWAENPSMSHLDVKKHLMDTAQPIAALRGKAVTGARLDLGAAMKGDKPKPPVDDNPGKLTCSADHHALTASDSFLWSDSVQVGQNANVLSVKFELPETMAVDITAHSSARRLDGRGTTYVRTGLYDQANVNAMWSESYRRVSFQNTRENKVVSTTTTMVMPKGVHEVFWKVWVNDAVVRFDSGVLNIQAFPCHMADKGPSSAAEADVTEASRAPN